MVVNWGRIGGQILAPKKGVIGDVRLKHYLTDPDVFLFGAHILFCMKFNLSARRRMRAISFLFLPRAEKSLLCRLHYLNPTASKPSRYLSARLSTSGILQPRISPSISPSSDMLLALHPVRPNAKR